MFGSGAAHGIYSQFIWRSGVHNKGKGIGLLRGAGTKIATNFYVIMRLVSLQAPLLATVHQAIFLNINLNDRVRSAAMDIKNETFWKALYTLLRSVYSAIQDICYCHSNLTAMEKIYHLSNRPILAIERSCEMLNDDDLFGPIEGNSDGLEFELTDFLGPEVNNSRPSNTISSSNSSDDDINDEDNPMTL